MGIDTTPVLPYFPVILIYAIIHLNDKNEFVRQTMHKLLTRLMAALGDPVTIRFALFAFALSFDLYRLRCTGSDPSRDP